MLLLWTLGTSPHPQSTRFVNVNLNLFPWFCWWSRGKIKWLTTSQNTWGELDSQAWQPRHPRHNHRCKQRDVARAGARHYAARKYSRFFLFFLKFTVIYIICCLYTYVNFLFGNILSVVNVYCACACSGALVLSLTEDWEGRGCVVTTTDHWQSAGRGCVS